MLTCNSNTVVYIQYIHMLAWLIRPAPLDYCVHVCPPSGLGSLTNDVVYLCLVRTCWMFVWSLYRRCLHMWRPQGQWVSSLQLFPSSVMYGDRKAINTLANVKCSVTMVYADNFHFRVCVGKLASPFHYALVVSPDRVYIHKELLNSRDLEVCMNIGKDSVQKKK